jgi:hypothetical protein
MPPYSFASGIKTNGNPWLSDTDFELGVPTSILNLLTIQQNVSPVNVNAAGVDGPEGMPSSVGDGVYVGGGSVGGGSVSVGSIGVGVHVGVGVFDGYGVLVVVGVGVFVGLGVFEGVALGVSVGSSFPPEESETSVAVDVGEEVAVGLAVAVNVGERVEVGVTDGSGVCVGS